MLVVMPVIGGILGFVIGGCACVILYWFSVLNRSQLIFGAVAWVIIGILTTAPLIVHKAKTVRLMIKAVKEEELEQEGQPSASE
jgi:ABC-type molybdate transport system permease subunit